MNYKKKKRKKKMQTGCAKTAKAVFSKNGSIIIMNEKKSENFKMSIWPQKKNENIVDIDKQEET